MSHFKKVCLDCEREETDPMAMVCTSCSGLLGFDYNFKDVSWDDRFQHNMWRYWPLLPINDPDSLVTLDEGATPLLSTRTYGNHEIYVKDETRNPTGSHKDRALSVAINHGKSIGAEVTYIVSTGSAGVSNAALSARAGMRSVIVMCEGTPAERLYPLYMLGATLVEVSGDIDPVVDLVADICREHGLYSTSTSRKTNPYQSEGNKTIAFEIVEQLGRAPDWMVVPVGGGGSISGIWRGFCDLKKLNIITTCPKMIGVVPHDYNALEIAFDQGIANWNDVMAMPFEDAPPSVLVKLAHPYPPDQLESPRAIKASEGFFISVTDEEALNAQQKIGHSEGLYIEPSSGACLAGLSKLVDSGKLQRKESVVAMISGSGFRETATTMEYRPLKKQSTDLKKLSSTLVKATQVECLT